MNYLLSLFSTVSALLLMSSPAAWAKLNVVATTPDLAALAKAIGGDQIELTTLAKPTEDPHFVDPKPSFIVKLNRADVLVEGGADLEAGWLGGLLDQSRNPKIAPGTPGRVACAKGVTLRDIPTRLDRSRGDLHAAGNPHYLMDPANAKPVAQRLAQVFGALDPDSSSRYRENLKQFEATLEARLAEWEKKLAPFQGQQIVAYHNSWLYFGARFGLRMDVFLEPKPGVPPTPSHLADVILRMKQEHAHVILVDTYVNRRTADAVAAKTGATVVEVSQFPGGVRGTEAGYIALMDYLVNAVAQALAAGKP